MMTPTTPYKSSQQQFAARLRDAVSHSQGRGLFRRAARATGTPRTFAQRLRSSLEHR
jgi:hypothetical protein